MDRLYAFGNRAMKDPVAPCPPSRRAVVGLAILAAVLGGCSSDVGDSREVVGVLQAQVVDRLVEADAALAGFQRESGEAPDGLAGGVGSPEELLQEIRRALAGGDGASLERLAISRGEFAYLYYPSSPLAQPPYELPPALAWFQLHQGSRKGATRLLRELGGRDRGSMELLCLDAPVEQGEVRILSGCRVQLAAGAELRLFGSLIEYGGKWKVLTFANDF